MNLTTVKVELFDVPGALLRALALAERRGYEVRRVEVQPGAPGRLLAQLLCRFEGRSAEQLLLQLGKLIDVAEVQSLGATQRPVGATPGGGEGPDDVDATFLGGRSLLMTRFGHG